MYTEMKILCNEIEPYAELEPCTVQQCETDAVPDVKDGEPEQLIRPNIF